MHEDDMDNSYDDVNDSQYRQNRFGGNQNRNSNLLRELEGKDNTETYEHNDTYADIDDDDDDNDNDPMESKAEYNSEDDDDMQAHYRGQR